jgi:hypothetical protein
MDPTRAEGSDLFARERIGFTEGAEIEMPVVLRELLWSHRGTVLLF